MSEESTKPKKPDDTAEELPEVEVTRVSTKDMKTICALQTIGHIPERIVTNEAGGKMEAVYIFPETAFTDYTDYTLGKDFQVSLRKYETIMGQFKDNIHRLSHR